MPTVHLQYTARAAVKAYAATAQRHGDHQRRRRSSYNAAGAVHGRRSPRAARLLAGNGDLLKPDLIAPGQDILAGVAPPAQRPLFDLYSGTSMSSPHVAGLAALLKEAQPGWSPMAIKSALMTTGYDVLDGHAGAEHQPGADLPPGRRPCAAELRASNPGLVFDSGFNDWLALPLRHGQPVAPSARHSRDRPERPERAVDRDRRHGRRADGHAHGHQRRWHAGDLHAVGHRHGRASTVVVSPAT